MIAQPFYYTRAILLFIFFMPFKALTQEETSQVEPEAKIKIAYKTEFYDLRGTNAFDIAIGTSVINGDLSLIHI